MPEDLWKWCMIYFNSSRKFKNVNIPWQRKLYWCCFLVCTIYIKITNVNISFVKVSQWFYMEIDEIWAFLVVPTYYSILLSCRATVQGVRWKSTVLFWDLRVNVNLFMSQRSSNCSLMCTTPLSILLYVRFTRRLTQESTGIR